MTRIVLRSIFIGVLTLLAFATHAYNDRTKQQLNGAAIQQGAVIQVQDPRMNEMQSGAFSFTNVKVMDEIMLAIDLKTYNPSSDFTTTVNLNVDYDEWSGSQFIHKTKAISLSVNYAVEGVFKDKAVHRFNGAHNLSIAVTQVSGPTNMIVLQGVVDVSRYDNFNVQTAVAGNLAHQFKAERNELVVSWDAITGAEEYDVEWTWINDYNTSDTPLDASQISIDKNTFRLNSSRVTVVARQYAIPLLYDRGYIIYRVRGNGRTGIPPKPLEGRWSYEPADGHTVASAPHKFLFHGHQNNLNWQASISYAEEGKNKAAISYFDGSLKNRQAVSRINSEDKIIVGETIYDHQGRPSIQVLPVPSNTSKIGYQRSFNVNTDGKPYSRDDFDKDSANCDTSAPGMATTTGASQYYSPANPDKNGAQAYLPDAQQYPFTQTEYTPDNTWRIRRQSGVGPDHKLGSGHETKYFYGKPSQEELDKMFGADVGYAKHYKKNMVVDANGQISVSYLDAQGKVIATALAGEAPANLMDISKPEETVTTKIDLLAKTRPSDRTGAEDKLSENGRSKSFSKEILVTQNSTREFNYDVKINKFTDDCAVGPSGPLCYGCVLNLTISITDECGNEVIPGIGGTGLTTKQIGTVDLACNSDGVQFTSSFNTLNQLAPGNYSLNRKLSIDEDALDQYTEDFLARQNDCLLTFDHFLEEEAKNVQLFDCEADCQSCRDAVGSYGKYTGPNCNPCLTQEEYNNLLDECDFLCDDELVQCSNAYNMMLGDVSPFGQYGEVMNAVTVAEDGTVAIPETAPDIDPSQFPLSVFNEHNKLPKNNGGAGNWKMPKDGVYLSEDGTPSMIDVLALEDESGTLVYSPEVESDAIPADAKHGTVFQVPPQKLLRVKDFIANWETSWAEQLVHLHPEYGYYQFCNILESSHRWDAKWLATDSYEEAVANGYIENGVIKPNPLATSGAISDPYFSQVSQYLETTVSSRWTSYNSKEKEAMNRSLNHFSENFDIWNVVHRTINCPFDDSHSNVCQVCVAYDGINTDEEWNTFKSMYFSLKQQFVERKTSLYAIGTECYNGCIGTQYYSPFSFSFYKHNVFDFITTLSLLTDSDQPCNWKSWKSGIYAKKSKRFPLSTDMINVSEMDLEACYTGFDDNTPPNTQELPADQQVACSNTLRDILEDTQLEADISFYETCGQCPVVQDLQNLMNAVAVRKELEKDNVLLSCYPEGKYPEFVPELKKMLEQTIPGDGRWYWDKVTSSNGELLVNLTKLDNTGTCDLRLKILTPGISFSSIQSLCCMNYTATPTFYPLTGKGNFVMRATVAGRTEKIAIEGFIGCADLTTCPFPPKCQPTKEAGELQTVMNSLLFDFTLGGNSQNLFSPTPVKLYEAPYKDIVNGTLAPLQQNLSGTNWTWRSEIAGNILTGYIEDGKGGRCLIELRPATNIPFDVKKILGFANMRPDRKHPDDPAHNFLVTAIVATNQGTARVKMSGYSACLAIGSCEQVTERQ